MLEVLRGGEQLKSVGLMKKLLGYNLSTVVGGYREIVYSWCGK